MSKELDPAKLPKHVGLIPDGNRRWAEAHGLTTFEGHQRGYERIREISKKARELGIPVFTAWAFSTENWSRPQDEVDYLMGIFEQWIDDNLQEAIRDRVRIIHLGKKDRLSDSLREKIERAEVKTRNFDKNYFVIALDYGGRNEVARAVKRAEEQGGTLSQFTEAEIEKRIEAQLDTSILPFPNPDFVIRTSGEKRTSGFLMWQGTYAELDWVEEYLPDFTPELFEKSIREYVKRERRFGK